MKLLDPCIFYFYLAVRIEISGQNLRASLLYEETHFLFFILGHL